MGERTIPDGSYSMLEPTIVEGEHTNALVYAGDEMLDDYGLDQIAEMVDHEAFQGKVRLMPDVHGGAGAVIGFTMPLGERIVPNTVGVDIGCGVSAVELDVHKYVQIALENDPAYIDESIRKRVPMGRSTFGDVEADQDYHIVDDFPWDVCKQKVQTLQPEVPVDIDDEFGKDYFLDLCHRVGYQTTRAINSIGTLGGGNHFIEIARSQESGSYWAVVHSGSRGIGLSIAEYWQGQAHENCDQRGEDLRDRLDDVPDWAYKFDLDEVSNAELLDWVQGGMGEDWKATEAIRERLEHEEIGALIDTLKDITTDVHESGDGDELDYLDGHRRGGYLKDMAFAQTYAEESRQQMLKAIADVLLAHKTDAVSSTHNYIDYEDGIIRKGATRVHEGQRAIVPFNMADGSVIVEGKGNDAWNRSAPHGAGRRGSRRWAFDSFEMDTFRERMDGVFSTSVTEETLDEAPMAYKDEDSILEWMQRTAEVIDVLDPVLNIKALE